MAETFITFDDGTEWTEEQFNSFCEMLPTDEFIKLMNDIEAKLNV